MGKLRGISAVVCLLFSCVAGSFGQGTTSRLQGTVQDTTGAAVAGATVRLVNEGTGVAFTTQSTESGTYVFEAVQSGAYTVEAEAAGFRRFISRNNVVSVGQPATVRIALEIGAVTEQVEVTSTYEQVQTSTSGNIGGLLTEKTIRDLPIVGSRGRNPLELVLRQPGVVSGANTGGGVHIHGARDRAWNFTLDGIDINETSAGGGNFSPLRANPDSLAEMRILTSNFTAEYGRNSGGQVAMVTKSGTNELHGSGFWFYRTPRLNANEWEFNVNGTAKRQFVQNILGGSLGGPIIKNRTFYFGNLQVLRARESSVTTRTVYTAQARQGILRFAENQRNIAAGAPGAVVDMNGNPLPGINIVNYNVVTNDPERLGLDRRIQSLIQNTPLPNNFLGGDGLNTALFIFPALQREKQYDSVIKLDHVINSRNAAYARAAWGRQDTNCDRVNGGSPWFPDGDCVVNTKRDPRNLAFNWRYNPTARITNEFVVGYNYFTFDFSYPTTDINKITLEGAPVTVPETFVAGNLRSLKTWQFVDNFSYVLNRHALKFGTNLRFQKHIDVRGSVAGQNAGQVVTFSRTINTVDPARFNLPANINTQFDRPNLESHINFLLGRVGGMSRAFVAEGDSFRPGLYNFEAKFPELDFFAQDTWKVTNNLSIDLGLRLEAKLSPRAGQGGQVLAPSQPLVAGAAPTNTARWQEGKLYKDDWNNWSPSVGFAWDPFGRSRTAIRSNYRIAYDRINTFLLSSAVFQNLPGRTLGVVDQSYGQAGGRLSGVQLLTPPNRKPSEFLQPATYSNNNITVMDPNFETPTTHQWSFGVQQQVAKNSIIEVNYIGRRAHNLFGAYNANQVEMRSNGLLDAFRTVKAGGESAILNQLLTPDTRRNANETGSAMIRRLFPAELQNNSVGAIAANLALRNQGGRSLPELAGLSPFFLIPFPQFANLVATVDSNDFSTYHGLELQFERRFVDGLTFQAAYTLSKSLDTRSYDPGFTVAPGGSGQSSSSVPFDIYNRKLNYARSDFDRRHVVQSYWIYELPLGRGRRWDLGGLGNQVLGGWQVSGLMTIQSGRPFTVYSGNLTFNSVVSSTVNCTGCNGATGSVHEEGGIVWYFHPEERAAMSNPSIGEVGNAGRNLFTGPGSFNMDASLQKRFRMTERYELELRADAINLTNTPTFGFPTATLTGTTFGRIRDTVLSFSRKVQLGAKFTF